MLFYNAKDIQIITGVSRSKSYDIVRQLTKDIIQAGKMTPKAGSIQREYFCERFSLKLKDCDRELQNNKKLIKQKKAS